MREVECPDEPTLILAHTNLHTGDAGRYAGEIYLEMLGLSILFSNRGVAGLPGLESAADIPWTLGQLKASNENFQVRGSVLLSLTLALT